MVYIEDNKKQSDLVEVKQKSEGMVDTVGGSEIRWSPVEEKEVEISLLQGFSTMPGGCLGFLNHQQD